MADLSDLKPSISSLSTEELQDRLIELRQERRGRIVSAKKAKKAPKEKVVKPKGQKKALKELLQNLSPEELRELLESKEADG